MPRLFRWLAILALGCVASGCVTMEEVIAVEHKVDAVAPVPGAPDARVTVEMIEERKVGNDVVSRQIDGFGYPHAPIRVTPHPRELVRLALEAELRARGFRIAPGGAVVRVQLLEMWTTWRLQTQAKSGPAVNIRQATTRLRLQVRVLDANRGDRFGTVGNGYADVRNSMLTQGPPTRDMIEDALRQSMQHVLGSPGFVAALLPRPAVAN